jgi:hypothetical protein
VEQYRRHWEERLDRLGEYLKELQAQEAVAPKSKEKKHGPKK